MSCAVCGMIQAARCEGGLITYLSGVYGCPKNPARPEPRLDPDFIMPALLVGDPAWKDDARFGEPFEKAHTVEDWSVPGVPSAAGLEDLL